jgi:hypothetical protein
VRIKKGWDKAGRVGKTLGPVLYLRQNWTPVLWEDAEDPDWHKTVGLEEIGVKKERYIHLDGKTVDGRDIPESKRDFPTFVRRDGHYYQFVRADSVEVIYQEVKFARTI